MPNLKPTASKTPGIPITGFIVMGDYLSCYIPTYSILERDCKGRKGEENGQRKKDNTREDAIPFPAKTFDQNLTIYCLYCLFRLYPLF